jgi:hypothetical protein
MGLYISERSQSRPVTGRTKSYKAQAAIFLSPPNENGPDHFLQLVTWDANAADPETETVTTVSFAVPQAMVKGVTVGGADEPKLAVSRLRALAIEKIAAGADRQWVVNYWAKLVRLAQAAHALDGNDIEDLLDGKADGKPAKGPEVVRGKPGTAAAKADVPF